MRRQKGGVELPTGKQLMLEGEANQALAVLLSWPVDDTNAMVQGTRGEVMGMSEVCFGLF